MYLPLTDMIKFLNLKHSDAFMERSDGRRIKKGRSPVFTLTLSKRLYYCYTMWLVV